MYFVMPFLSLTKKAGPQTTASKKLGFNCFHDEWWIVFAEWLTDERRFALFPEGTLFRDPHHRKSPTRHEQGLNLRKTWIQA